MVDLANSANLVFYVEKNSLLLDLSPPTVLTVELSNLNQSFFYGTVIPACALKNDWLTWVAMMDFANSANLVFHVELSNFDPSIFMEPSYRLVLYMTIVPLISPWWTSQFPPICLLYRTKLFVPKPILSIFTVLPFSIDA